MDRGYVKLWRKSMDSRVFSNDGLWKVWTWCLMKASHKERWWEMKTGKSIIEIKILPGQFVYGRLSAAKELNMKPSTVRNRMKKLQCMQNLDIKEASQYSIISIINWECYQPLEEKEDSKEDNQRTIKGQSKDTDKNVNNVNNKKPSPKKPGEAVEKEVYKTAKGKSLTGNRLSSFKRFWIDFGDFRGKAAAADSWLNIPVLTNSLVDQICEAARIENIRGEEIKARGGSRKMAQGWLSARRWEDEIYKTIPKEKPKTKIFIPVEGVFDGCGS